MFAKWTRPHGSEDAEVWTETDEAPTINGWEMRHDPPPVLISQPTEPMAVSENQRAELRLTEYSRQITSGGGKPGQGYPTVLTPSTSSTAGSRVRTSAWPASGPVYPAHAAVCGLNSSGLCATCGHDGSPLKMFPDCFPAMGEPTSVSFSGGWSSSGMASRGELWTRGGSESPSVVAACSLSAVLEVQPVPRKYWLSAKAAAGILRRAEKRGKTLPTALQQALKGLATSMATPGTARISPP